MPDESTLQFTGIKAMRQSPPYGTPPATRPNFFTPYGWYLQATVPGAGVGQPPLIPAGVYATSILFDPFNWWPGVPEGGVVSTGREGFGPAYKATADQTRAMVSVRFDTATVPEGTIHTYDLIGAAPGYHIRTVEHYGLLYPAGTATNDGEFTFFPPTGIYGYGTDPGYPLSGAPGGFPGGPFPYPFYEQALIDILPDGSGWFGPPLPMPSDIYAPSGEYLVGHIGFPPGSYYRGASQGLDYFALSSLSVTFPAAPPYRPDDLKDEYDFPTVQIRFAPFGGGGGGGGGVPQVPTVTPALCGRPSRHYNRAATLTSGAGHLGLYFWRSDRPVPKLDTAAVPPRVWDTGTAPRGGPVLVTGQTADNSPRVAEDSRGLLYILFNRPSSGAMLTRSDDDGETWGTPILAISGGAHPELASADGYILSAAVTTTGTGTSAVHHIQGRMRGPGDGVFGAQFVFQTSTDGVTFTPLPVADDSFGIAFTAEGPDRLALHVLMAGEVATSDWWSADGGKSWTRVPLS